MMWDGSLLLIAASAAQTPDVHFVDSTIAWWRMLMRTRILPLVVAALWLMSFNANADVLTTPLSMRSINASFALEPGPTAYSSSSSADPASLYDPRYKLDGVSISDITISTKGPDLGTFSGTVKV